MNRPGTGTAVRCPRCRRLIAAPIEVRPGTRRRTIPIHVCATLPRPREGPIRVP